jgi:hypothetical protein
LYFKFGKGNVTKIFPQRKSFLVATTLSFIANNIDMESSRILNSESKNKIKRKKEGERR